MKFFRWIKLARYYLKLESSVSKALFVCEEFKLAFIDDDALYIKLRRAERSLNECKRHLNCIKYEL